jgi:hypothetical protein
MHDDLTRASLTRCNLLLCAIQDGVLGGIMETNASDRISANHPGGNEKADEPVSLVPFEPPVFGITFIGTSHGFDAKGFFPTSASRPWPHTTRVCPLTRPLLRTNDGFHHLAERIRRAGRPAHANHRFPASSRTQLLSPTLTHSMPGFSHTCTHNYMGASAGHSPPLCDQGDPHALSQRSRLRDNPNDPRRYPADAFSITAAVVAYT